jgi:hypothetical protein
MALVTVMEYSKQPEFTPIVQPVAKEQRTWLIAPCSRDPGTVKGSNRCQPKGKNGPVHNSLAYLKEK